MLKRWVAPMCVPAFRAWPIASQKTTATRWKSRGVVAMLNRKKVLPVATVPAREPLYASEELYGIVPKDPRRPFDIREVIAGLPTAASCRSSRRATAKP